MFHNNLKKEDYGPRRTQKFGRGTLSHLSEDTVFSQDVTEQCLQEW
jgi:hypothetical protein